jgi:ABC-type multidrug transport system ATPase subunit
VNCNNEHNENNNDNNNGDRNNNGEDNNNNNNNNNKSLKDYREYVGFVPQEDIMLRELTVEENIYQMLSQQRSKN